MALKIRSGPAVVPTRDLEPVIESTVSRLLEKQVLRTLNRGLIWLFATLSLVLVGAVFAVVYDLNGKIYEAAGKREGEASQWQATIQNLKDENRSLRANASNLSVCMTKKSETRRGATNEYSNW